MGKLATSGIIYRFSIFLVAWVILVGAIWINYREWIMYDWGLPLLPWIVMLIGIYGVETQLAASGKSKKHHTRKSNFKLKFWKDIIGESFRESWHGLRVELIIIVATSFVFAAYYLFAL